jgi:hypothetical protein
MKTSFRTFLSLAFIICFSPFLSAQNIYQLSPLAGFGSHSDGSLRPGDNHLDSTYDQRGMSFDPVSTNLVLVDTHTGQGASDHGVGHIYILNALTGNNLDDGSGGDFILNTNGIPTVGVNQAYPYAPAAVADDGVVYVCNQVNNSSTTPFIIYRWESTTSTLPPSIAFSNNLVPAQRYGTSIDIRGAGPNTQIIIGSLANGSSGTNVVIFTTTDGLTFAANILGADTTNPNFNDGVAFGPGDTFWAKQIGAPLRFMAFNLAAHTATTVKAFSASTFPDNDNLGAIAVNTNLNLLAAIEEAGGNPSGGSERVRLYDISNFSNQPPALLDVQTFSVDNPNATAPMGYLDFGGTNLYAYVINNGILGFGIGLAPAPPPQLTAIPPATNQTVVGRTVNITVAGFPSVHYQWQSNSVDIPNATNGTLTLVNVQPNFAALYTCVVTNTGGSTNASSRLLVVSSANFYHLNLQWTAFPGDSHNSDTHSYIQNANGATPSTPNQRSIGYNALSNHLYVISRSGFGNNPSFSNYVFNVVDASTGNLLWTMNTNGITLGVGQGGVGLASITVADDGAIYACNVAPVAGGGADGDQTKIFRLYRWADGNSNTSPVQIYTGDPAINSGIAGATSTNRWGDTLAVRGTGTNTLLLLDNNNANVRYVAILRPTDSTMTTWTTTGLHETITGTTIGRSLEFGSGGSTTSGSFWQKRNTTPFIQSSFDLINPADPVPELVRTPAGTFTNALSGGTIDSARHLLLGVSTYANALITPDTLDLYEISDITSPLLLAQYSFPVNSGTNHNGNAANCINQTIRNGDKVFTLDAGNGLMAFNIAAGPPTAPVFISQPQDIRVIQGGFGSFTVSVDQQASFQWRFAGVSIPGATSPTYTLTNAQLTNAGEYRVVASNIFGVSTSAVAIATVILPQNEWSLSQLWSITPTNGNGNIVNANGGGTPNQRSIAYNALSNHLYVVSRLNPASISNYAIYVLDASTGALISSNNIGGLYNGGAVGEGGVGLVGIGVADDGAIYACNMTPDACGCGPSTLTNVPADSLFRVYRLASDANFAPTLIFSGDPAGQATPLRWGDTLTVRGSGMNTEILLDSQPGSFAAILKPADLAMTTWTNQFFSTIVPGSSIGRSLQFGAANTFWQKRTGFALQLSSYNAAAHTSSAITNYPNFTATLGSSALDFSRSLLAGIDFKGALTNSPDAVDLYEMSNPNQPLLIAQYNFPTNAQANGNFIGQAVFAGTRVWALDGNNGLMAFTISGPSLTVSQSGATVVVSWTTNLVGQTLQSATNVAGPYSDVANIVTIVNDRYTITDDTAGIGRFYRLRN